MLWMSVITLDACRKFLGCSVDFPSTEVHLKRGLKSNFLEVDRLLSMACNDANVLPYPRVMIFFFFLDWLGDRFREGEGEVRPLDGEVERLLDLPVASGLWVFAGNVPFSRLFHSTSTSLFLFLRRLLFLLLLLPHPF